MFISSRLFVLVFALVYLPVVMAHKLPDGEWTTIDDTTGVKRSVVLLSIHDNVLNGVIEKVFPQPGDTGICSACPDNFKDQPILGLKFLWGLKEVSPGAWDGGHILDPKTGKIYRVKMTMKGNKLYVRGYVGFAVLGRTQVWLRD